MVTKEVYEIGEEWRAAKNEYDDLVNAGKGVPGYLGTRLSTLAHRLDEAKERQSSLVKQLEELASILDNPAARDAQSRLVVVRLRPMAEQRKKIADALNAYPPYLGGRAKTVSYQMSLG